MTLWKLNAAASFTPRHVFPVLLGLLLGALVCSTGCAQVEEVAQQVQQQGEASACDAATDNFDEDWPRIVADQRERAPHKALAYSKAVETECFAWGYSYDYESRQDAVERALSECRSFKAEKENERGRPYGNCTVHSVDGERQ